MKIAVVAGGWHFPLHFYEVMSAQLPADVGTPADLFVIAHRSPDLQIVREEKIPVLNRARGPLADLDRILYRKTATMADLARCGWQYQETPNICGDWCFLNQWLDLHDYHSYDVILSCHDDTFLRRGDLFLQLNGTWLMLANGDNAVEDGGCYVRGSFEFWKPELLDMLGGKVPLGDLAMTREGKTDSPSARAELQTWNSTCLPLRKFMEEHQLASRIGRLSPYYRVSRWAIEGERGFLHQQASAPQWRMDDGLAAYPI